MKIFPDIDTRKRFMKTFLPYILGFAWIPIIWILILPVLAPLFIALTGSVQATHLIILLLAVLASWLLLKLFRRFNFSFYEHRKN
jgi:hypothetical protein